jgi:hypothetical protein
LKQIVTILLATLILLQPFSKICIYVSFKINQDRIAKTLCVQKEIKNNCCKGKCHLEKELKKADEQRRWNPEDLYRTSFYLIDEECHPMLFEVDLENPEALPVD